MKVYTTSKCGRLFRVVFFWEKDIAVSENFWFPVLTLHVTIVETEAVALLVTPGAEDEE